MSNGTLMLHAGGKVATREQVFTVQAPSPTETWFPVAHGTVLAKVEELLDKSGFHIVREQLALARDGNRFFGVLDLESKIADGVGLVLGLRNSIDRSFSYGLSGGTRTFVCDNLALTGDWDELTISRKHTRFGEHRFVEALSLGISKLAHYREIEGVRVDKMRSTAIGDEAAYALFMRAFEAELLSHRVIRDCLRQWKDPGYDWGPPTLWRLYNAMNAPIQHKAITNPQQFSYQTHKLLGLVCPLGGDEPLQVEATPILD